MSTAGKVKLIWSSDFAYAIGLITTDGCLSGDGRHIILTSKDREQLENFLKCLRVKKNLHQNRSSSGRIYLKVQLGDVNFYRFLLTIGLMPRKSKILKEIKIPEEYFFDFLRGHFDGDGTFYSYMDKRWKSSYMFYTCFVSASWDHIDWIQKMIYSTVGIKGHITKVKTINWIYQLRYAKKESMQLLSKLYYKKSLICLSRKRKKIENALKKIQKIL